MQPTFEHCRCCLQKEGLAKDKETLTRNISSLFKTAQMEVQRKVEEIKQLRQRSAALNSASLRPPLSPVNLLELHWRCNTHLAGAICQSPASYRMQRGKLRMLLLQDA